MVEIKVVEAKIPTPETLTGYDPNNVSRRRFYVMNNGEDTFNFVDTELNVNQRRFQKPCMEVGEVIHYRTHSETLVGYVNGHSEFKIPKMTVTYVDFRPKNPGCLALKLATEDSK